jgi:hypothetical protein
MIAGLQGAIAMGLISSGPRADADGMTRVEAWMKVFFGRVFVTTPASEAARLSNSLQGYRNGKRRRASLCFLTVGTCVEQAVDVEPHVLGPVRNGGCKHGAIRTV